MHELVIGGSKVTAPAGHYPRLMADKLIKAAEAEFNVDPRRVGAQRLRQPREVLAGEAGGDGLLADDQEGDPAEERDLEDDLAAEEEAGEAVPYDLMDVDEAAAPSKAIRQAVCKLHANTGHRHPLRLARALAIAGAPADVIQAAKTIRCGVCKETSRPKTRQPASVPKPKHVGDVVSTDLFSVKDLYGKTWWFIHGVDGMSRYQIGSLRLRNA